MNVEQWRNDTWQGETEVLGKKICAEILKDSLNRTRDFQGTKTKFLTYCNKVTNGCKCLFCVFISFIFTLHVSGSHKPIMRGISSCFLYTTIWFMWCLCCSSACACACAWTSPQAHADEQHKHHMNQMVVYIKNSFRYPWWWAYESPKPVGQK